MEPQNNPLAHKPEVGAPYCSDPNCPYCKELRETEDLVRTGRPLPPRVIKRTV